MLGSNQTIKFLYDEDLQPRPDIFGVDPASLVHLYTVMISIFEKVKEERKRLQSLESRRLKTYLRMPNLVSEA